MVSRWLPLSLVILFVCVPGVCAERVAVFPVEDLSQGKNSVNFEFTDYLAHTLQVKGLDVISEAQVISFMAQNRIRWVGYLDTRHVLMAKEELGADFLLFGTICQRRESVLPALGLTLNLVRTSDADTVWSDSGGLSTTDVQHLLGLSEPGTVAELLPLLADNVMFSWPADFESGLSSRRDRQPDEIESVTLEPRYLRSGEEVRCIIKLRPMRADEVRPVLYIKVGNRVYLAQEAPSGLEYEAAWIGSEGRPHGPVVTSQDINLAALEGEDSAIFESIWIEEDKDAHYPVSLVLSWPSGHQEGFFVGSYVVDSRAPEASLELVGTKIRDIVAFKDKVDIIPHIVEREQLSHWQIAVENEEGKIIALDEGNGNLPYRFTWKGQFNNGRQVEEGKYEIILSFWDRADNMGRASQYVYFIRTPPVLELQARNQTGKMFVDIHHEGQVPLDYWSLEIWSDQGVFLKAAEGEDLPATVEVPLAQLPETVRMEGILFARDILGNQSRQEIKDLSRLVVQDGVNAAETKSTSSDNNVWNADF
jgi:hypothetical protein